MRLLRAFAVVVIAGYVVACSGGQHLVPNASFANGEFARYARQPLSGAAACTSVWAYGTKTPYANGNGNAGQGYYIAFADKSGMAAATKKPAYLYVEAGGKYLNTSTGQWTNWTGNGPQPGLYEYPLECFVKKPFYVPPVSGVRIYISYGALVNLGSSQQPDGDIYPGNVPGHMNANYSTYWDLFEYSFIGTNQILTDTSAVDAFGLPLYVTIANPVAGNIPKYGPAKPYATIFTALQKAPYNRLTVWGCAGQTPTSTTCKPVRPGPKSIPMRFLSPAHGTVVVQPPNRTTNSSFPVTLLYDKAYFNFTGPKGYDNGYLGYVEDYYAKNGKKMVFVPYQVWSNSSLSGKPAAGCDTVKANNVPGAIYPCPLYVPTYNATTKQFVFTLIKPAPSPVAGLGAFPNVVTIPAGALQQVFKQVSFDCVQGVKLGCTATPGSGVWNNSGITCPPPKSATPCFSESYNLQVPFYLYKALAADLSRGVATQVGNHSVLPCKSVTNCAKAYVGIMPYGATYYRDPNVTSKTPALFSIYAQILHDYSVGGWSYANSYDDYFNQSTTSTGYVNASNKFSGVTITILPMTR